MTPRSPILRTAVACILAAMAIATEPVGAQYGGDPRHGGGHGRGGGGYERGGDGYRDGGDRYRDEGPGEGGRGGPGPGRRGYPRGGGPYGRPHRCRDNGTSGTIIGAIAGGLLGNSIAGYGDRAAGTIVGGGAGAIAGRVIGRDC